MRKDLPKPPKPKPSRISKATEPLKKSKTNPGLSYTSSGKTVFTPTPAKPKAQPRATGPDGAPFKYITNQMISQFPLKISQLNAYKPAAPVVKNTPAVAAKAAVKGVKKVAR